MSDVKYPLYIIKDAYRVAQKEAKKVPNYEHILIQHPEYAALYAINILQERWPEAEPIILTNPVSSWKYLKVIECPRWPAAEYIFSKNKHIWRAYNRRRVKDKFKTLWLNFRYNVDTM